MKRFTIRKVVGSVGAVLGTIGALVLVGSVTAWYLGPELLSHLYETTKPYLVYFLAGLGLLVLGCLLASWGTPGAGTPRTGSLLDAAREGKIRCRQCAAVNDGRAKFCNQCGAPV